MTMDEKTSQAIRDASTQLFTSGPLSKGRLRKRLMLGHIVVFVAAIVVTMVALAVQIHMESLQQETQELKALAEIIASNIPSAEHRKLAGRVRELWEKKVPPESIRKEITGMKEYGAVERKFETVKRSAKKVAHIHTLVRLNDEQAAIVTSDNPDQVGIVVHYEPQPEMKQGFAEPSVGPESMQGKRFAALAGYAPVTDADVDALVAVSRSEKTVWQAIAEFGWIWLLPLAAGLGLSALMAWRQAHGIMDPLTKTADIISRLSSGDMSARLSPTDPKVTRVLRRSVVELGSTLGRRQRISAYYGRTLTANMMERVMDAGEEKLTQIERRPVTLLRVDIATPVTLEDEGNTEKFLEAINTAARIVIEAILENGGSVEDIDSKIILGVFGSPLAMSNHLQAALQAAEEIQDDLANISARRKREGLPRLELNLWLHTGEAVLGLIGIPDRGEYRAMGEPVDTTLSLQCPEGAEISGTVVTEAVVKAADLDGKTRSVGSCTTPSGGVNLFQLQ